MKLGKEALLAMIECALFILGAIFFVAVIAIPSNPVWALVAGILFGLAGAIVWSVPLLVKVFRHNHATAADISQKIQGADKPENDTYELHRADSYDSLADAATRPTAAPTTPPEPTQPNPIE